MIYGSDLGITWLQDANYAQTSGCDADGRMNRNDSITSLSKSEFSFLKQTAQESIKGAFRFSPGPFCNLLSCAIFESG